MAIDSASAYALKSKATVYKVILLTLFTNVRFYLLVQLRMIYTYYNCIVICRFTVLFLIQ